MTRRWQSRTFSYSLPIVTLGLGFGIDYGLYVVSRIIEEIRVRGDLEESVLEALPYMVREERARERTQERRPDLLAGSRGDKRWR